MKIHEKVRKVFGMDEPLRPDIETFFVNEFDMNFTRLDAVSFVEELYQKCKDEGILLQAGVAVDTKLPVTIREQAIQKISNGQLQAAF
ncbi:MAG: hypothetical protein AAF599_12175 [Bacteroidota bacterium]